MSMIREDYRMGKIIRNRKKVKSDQYVEKSLLIKIGLDCNKNVKITMA